MLKRYSDDNRYQKLQAEQLEEWESLCTRCGACCGALDGDPCEHLIELPDGKYSCSIYNHRFGLHKTRSGRPFRCVPIRKILHKSWPGDECCAYKKLLKR